MEPLMNGNYTLEPYDATISESSDGFISGEEEEQQQQTPSPPYTQESTPIPQSNQQIEEEEKSLSIRKTPSPFTQFKVTKRKPYQRVIRRKGIYSIIARYMQEKVEIEKERLEFEKSQAVARAPIRQAEAQVAFINSWKSLGLSNKEILSKIAEIWK
jgi:hypothetical protein